MKAGPGHDHNECENPTAKNLLDETALASPENSNMDNDKNDLSVRSNYDMNALRAKNGYMVGFDDMEDSIVSMI